VRSPKKETAVVVLKSLVFDEVKADEATHSDIYPMISGPVSLFILMYMIFFIV
jgi:hypothetical protein